MASIENNKKIGSNHFPISVEKGKIEFNRSIHIENMRDESIKQKMTNFEKCLATWVLLEEGTLLFQDITGQEGRFELVDFEPFSEN